MSEADLISYITQLQGYVYGILAAFVVLILVLIFAHKAKRFPPCDPLGSGHGISGSNPHHGQCNLLRLMYNNVAGFLNASKAEFSEETIQNSKDVIKKWATRV